MDRRGFLQALVAIPVAGVAGVGIARDKLSSSAGKHFVQTEFSPELLGNPEGAIYLWDDGEVCIADKTVTLPPAHEHVGRSVIVKNMCSHEAVTVVSTGKDWVLI